MREADLVYSPLPHEVAGFDRAMASGVIRRIPTVPPAVTVLPTSRRALRDAAVVLAVSVAVVVAVLLVAPTEGALSGAGVLALLGSSALGVWAIAKALTRWGRLVLAELALGYTTTPPNLRTASWWVGAPGTRIGLHGIDWDWSGLWVLHPDGTVRSAPSRQGVPPGLYPSPRREGALELWTGLQWTAYFPGPAPGPDRGRVCRVSSWVP